MFPSLGIRNQKINCHITVSGFTEGGHDASDYIVSDHDFVYLIEVVSPCELINRDGCQDTKKIA